MAFHTNLQSAARHGTGDAKQNKTVVELTVVQRHLTAPIDFAGSQLGRAGNTVTDFTTIGQIKTVLAQGL